jgi:hypothetical protein
MRVVHCLAAAMACAAFSSATAQTRPRHEGWNIALGVGQGMLSATCSTCALVERERASLMVVRVGLTLTDRAIVGIDGDVYQRQYMNGRSETVTTDYQVVTLDGLFYSNQRSDIFLKVGFGFSHLRSKQNPGPGYRSMSATGPVFRFGAGFDMRFGRTWAVSPFVDQVVGLKGSSSVEDVTSKTSSVLFGLAVTWP